MPASTVSAAAALDALWRAAAMPSDALRHARLPGDERAAPVLASSFPVATAAQASLAAAALAAGELWWQRGGRAADGARQQVTVDLRHAALDSCAHFLVDGRPPHVWDRLSGLYPCGADADPGWVRIHANFAHHRDGALRLLGCATGAATERAAIEQALRRWRAEDFETAAADAGLVVAAARSFDAWDRHPQGQATRGLPTVAIDRIAAAPAADAAPRRWIPLPRGARPLHGLRVLDLTRILAGPVAGRTLAAYGADVMLINAPHLPNIEAIADTSRGKLSAHVDLRAAGGRATLQQLAQESHVFLQGYRPGALDALGFGPQELAQRCPGIVYVSLSAYGHAGPWAQRRGFDSLVQTATGFNVAEAQAAGATQPRALPLQILDYAAGYLLAFGTQVALLRQARDGGSWHVRVALAGVGHWLRGLGRLRQGLAAQPPSFAPYLETTDSGFGRLVAMRHAAQLATTPAAWERPAKPPGSDPPCWPAVT